MNLLAKSCFNPGIITLLSNLIKSSGDIDTSDFKEDWKNEYIYGIFMN